MPFCGILHPTKNTSFKVIGFWSMGLIGWCVLKGRQHSEEILCLASAEWISSHSAAHFAHVPLKTLPTLFPPLRSALTQLAVHAQCWVLFAFITNQNLSCEVGLSPRRARPWWNLLCQWSLHWLQCSRTHCGDLNFLLDPVNVHSCLSLRCFSLPASERRAPLSRHEDRERNAPACSLCCSILSSLTVKGKPPVIFTFETFAVPDHVVIQFSYRPEAFPHL